MQEDAAASGEDKAILQGEKKPTCSFWMLLAIVQFIIVIFLILALCGVLDSLTDSDNESGAAGLEDDDAELFVLDTETEDDADGDSYLTGDVAPNIIFLMGDDIGWADISHNDGTFSTPNIDAILEDGLEFTKFYSHALCTPSRMAFLTGRMAWKLGSQYAEVIHAMMTGHVPFDELTFAEVTREMGYNNYYVGRWGVGYASWDMTPLGRGWDKFMGYFGPEGGYYNHTTDHFDEWYGVYDMWDMKEPYIDGNMTYSEDLFLARTIQYLEEAKLTGKPFTLTYASQTAHAPIDDDWPTFYPPTIWTECRESDPDLVGREYYCNKVKYLDYNWGVIVDHLKNHDMWDNTLILMMSDNGALPNSGNDGWSDWGCNWPLRSGKVANYEGGIKVWAGMSGGLLPAKYRGTTFDELTHITDFAATAMRLSMTKNEYDKRSTLTGTEKIVDGKNLFEFEYHDLLVHYVLPHYVPSWMWQGDNDYAATDGEWKYYMGFGLDSFQGPGWYNFPGKESVTEDNSPIVFEDAGGNCLDGCLFHLTTDPNEYTNVADDYPEITAYYVDLIDAIYQGGFDEDYHSGQPYNEDYRGYHADNIMWPYLNSDALTDYLIRTASIDSNYTYDYASYTFSWDGDYDGKNSPFDE